MTDIKTPAEIEALRKGGKLLAEILHKLGQFVEPGKSPMDIELHAAELMQKMGVKPCFSGYKGFPNICCISVNDHVVHGIPTDIPMQKGDLVTIDCGIFMEGLHTDAAISVIVGGDACATEKIRRLNETTKKALNKGISLVKPGVRTGDIGEAIQRIVESEGFSIIRELTGHGIGYNLHEEPTIANYGKRGSGMALKPGMTICIEPIVSAGERFIKTLDDRWTIAIRDGSWGCQWEHMILVTERGHEVLTRYEG